MLLSAYTVNSLGDSGTGSGTSGDLRYCITKANLSSNNTIAFSVNGTIQLTNALPALSENVTITGPGATSLTIEGGGTSSNFSVLAIDKGVTATISGLTLSGGHTTTNGGGIDNLGTMTLTDCTISNDTAITGGGIFNTGTINLNGCTISNISGKYGGGITNYIGGTATVTGCTVADSTAMNQGGGISTYGPLKLINSTISGDIAPSAGGIFVDSESGSVTITNCTITGNRETGDGGGGIHAFGSTTLYNTIVCGNFGGAAPSTTPDDIAGSVNTSTSENNLIGTGGSGGLANGSNGNLVGIANPGLGTLGANGGPTQTIPLLAGSPAIDAGNNADALDANGQQLTTDQRGAGFPRIQGLAVDIGAFEFTPTSTAPPTLTAVRASAVSAATGQSVTFAATVSDLSAGGPTPTGGTVTFADQGGTIGTATLVNGVAEVTTTSLAAGADTVTASYGGTTSFAPSATGTIVTAAGTGTVGYSGDGGPATAAELNNPIGVAIDSAGDVFFDDTDNNVVRELVKSSGEIITVAGDGSGGLQRRRRTRHRRRAGPALWPRRRLRWRSVYLRHDEQCGPRSGRVDRRDHHHRRRRKSGL